MFAVKQPSDEFACALVEADELRTEQFRSEQGINCCGILSAHGIGPGKFEVYLCAPANQLARYRPGVERFAYLYRSS